MTQQEIKEELNNLEQKMQLAETAQDIWYIIDRLARAITNDQDLGNYVRKIARKELNKTMQ